MKFLLFLLLFLSIILVGCGGQTAASVESCTINKLGTIFEMRCPGQSPVLISNGADGTSGGDGKDGRDGVDGQNGRDGRDGRDGQDGNDGQDGEDGQDGRDGRDGSNGHDAVIAQAPAGESCANGGIIVMTATDINDNHVLDAGDSNLQSATLCNGINGTNGAGPSPLTPVSIVDPCGDSPNRIDEVFFRLQNGQLIASFSDDVGGTNTRFALLPAGNFVTTDGSLCYFTVTSTNQILNEHY